MKAAKTSIFVIGCVATKIIDETKHQPAMLGVGVLKTQGKHLRSNRFSALNE